MVKRNKNSGLRGFGQNKFIFESGKVKEIVQRKVFIYYSSQLNKM
jgi:hypothetical protein